MDDSSLSPIIIHFFGPDGAGKSTQADLLLVHLMRKNVKVRKYWTRSPHTLAYVLWELSLKIGFFRTVSNASGAYIKVPAVHRNHLLGRLWSLIELMSILPLIVRAQFYLLSGFTLIAERYVLDTIAFVAFSIDDLSFLKSPLLRLFTALIPVKTKFVFIDADYDTIYQRRVHFLSRNANTNRATKLGGSSIKTELEPREFIDFQRAVYKSLARTEMALVVNTAEHSQQETFNLVLNYVDLFG